MVIRPSVSSLVHGIFQRKREWVSVTMAPVLEIWSGICRKSCITQLENLLPTSVCPFFFFSTSLKSLVCSERAILRTWVVSRVSERNMFNQNPFKGEAFFRIFREDNRRQDEKVKLVMVTAGFYSSSSSTWVISYITRTAAVRKITFLRQFIECIVSEVATETPRILKNCFFFVFFYFIL